MAKVKVTYKRKEPVELPTIRTKPRSLLLALLKNAIASSNASLAKIYMTALIDDKHITLQQLDRFVQGCEEQMEEGSYAH